MAPQSPLNFPCIIIGCKKMFTRPDDRNRHVKEFHQKENRIECAFCGKSLLKRCYNRHLRSVNKCSAKHAISAFVSGEELQIITPSADRKPLQPQ